MTVLSNLQVSLELPIFVSEETPQPGTLPNTWTLAFTPLGTPQVYSNGVRQRMGASGDYTIAGNVLTSTLWAAQGGNLLADYSHN